MNEKTGLVIRYLSCVYLFLVFIWQGVLSWTATRFIVLLRNFGEEHYLITLLNYSRPLIWLFMIVTALLIFDVYRRKNVLLMNTLLIIAALTIATVFVQFYVVVGSYTPVFEASPSK